ncbi:hypothetical protein Tco_0903075 [Tanacetum coccineum]
MKGVSVHEDDSFDYSLSPVNNGKKVAENHLNKDEGKNRRVHAKSLEIMVEQEKQQIPITQGLPLTTDEP